MISTIFPMLCLCFPSNYTYSMPGVFFYFNSKSLSPVVSKESPVSLVHSLVSDHPEWADHFHNHHLDFLPPVLWFAVHTSQQIESSHNNIHAQYNLFDSFLPSGFALTFFFFKFKSLPCLYLFFWVHIFVMVIMKTARWQEHCLPCV